MLNDIRFGARLLWKEKALTLTVLLTLAVCIGANTAVYSVIDKVVLDPLPFPEPDRLVRVYNSYPNAGAERGSVSGPDYFYRREGVAAFANVAVYQNSGHTVGEAGSPERLSTMRVTASFFPMLGVQPFLGRTFTEDEMERGNAQKVVLSYGFWQERFGGADDVVGQDMRVDGRPFTIVGVLPESFNFLGQRDARFYVPIAFSPEEHTPARLHSNNYDMIARLAPGATPEQAQSQIAAMDDGLTDQVPIPNARQLLEDVGYHAEVHPLKADLLRDIRPTLFMLWAGVAFVLLIGCVNIANLMIARASVRVRELATRLALGAQRARLARQLVTEALLMAVIGGALGLGIGLAGIRFLGALGANQLPRGTTVGLDGGVVLFTLAIALVAGTIFGAIPLAHVFSSDLSAVFRAESRSGTASKRSVTVRSGLVTAQVAIAFVLLIGAGLMFASFRAALSVDPGFQPDHVLTGFVSLPESRYGTAAERRQFIDEALAEVRALPGVQSASMTTMLPFTGGGSSSVVVPEGYVPQKGESLLSPFRTIAGPEYFQTLGIPLVEGRTFQGSDNQDGDPVMVIDRWLAHRYWPVGSPLGHRMVLGVEGMEGAEYYTIIGVVGDIKQNDLTEDNHVGAYYFTYEQQPPGFLTITARTEPDPGTLIEPVRQAVSRIDPELPFFSPRTMQDRVDESLQGRRAPMMLLMVFAAVALFLAAIGIYGVLAYAVTQRSRELGLRMALGSSPRDLFRMVLGQGLRVIALGLAIGIAGSFLFVRLVSTLLFNVAPTDPAVAATVAATLALVGLAACALPARRATRIDPMHALTGE